MASFTREGSSPLARGLRSMAPPTRPPSPDHPRSRGVYRPSHRAHPPRDGSSPLARGLPTVPPGTSTARRIIPARAGFTFKLCDSNPCGWDHPRSRGVYPRPRGGVVTADGSSPLARGLRDVSTAFRSGPGIIPARAGFTSSTSRPRRCLTDHPRSRGVYGAAMPFKQASFGSSPLARGLRTACE